MNTENLLYVIPAGQYGKEGILALLEQHPEIKFVSLVGVDLAGNDTDEKIPISVVIVNKPVNARIRLNIYTSIV